MLVFACVCVCAASPAPSEPQCLSSVLAILTDSSLCISIGKGLQGRGCVRGKGKAVGEFSSPSIHAIVCGSPASLEMQSRPWTPVSCWPDWTLEFRDFK